MEFSVGALSLEYPSASELDLDTSVRHYIDIGTELVRLHQVGLWHGDMCPTNTLFSAAEAKAILIDHGPQPSGDDRNLSVPLAVADLATTFASFPEKGFRAICVGYIHTCYRILGARAADHLEAVFAELGISLPYHTIDAEHKRHLKVRKIYRTEIELFTSPRGSTSAGAHGKEYSEYLIYALFMLGFISERLHLHFSRSAIIDKLDLLQKSGSSVKSPQLLRAMLAARSEQDNLGAVYPRALLALDPDDARTATRGISDALDGLALYFDRSDDLSSQAISAEAAQLSAMMLQTRAGRLDPYEQEIDAIMFSSSHHELSWICSGQAKISVDAHPGLSVALDQAFKPPSEDVNRQRFTLVRLAYLNSAAALHFRFFEYVSRLPKGPSNLPWSHLRMAQRLSVEIFRSALDLAEQRSDNTMRNTFVAASLQRILNIGVMTIGHGGVESEFEVLRDGRGRLMRALSALQKQGLAAHTDRSTRKALADVYAHYVGDFPYE